MPSCLSTVICLPIIGRPGRFRYLSTSIHILDDDSLLNIFNFCRPVLSDEDDDDESFIPEGERSFSDHERWWYKLAQVCRRWRSLILASQHYLDLGIVCTYDTSVVDMPAHLPPLPLAIICPDPFHNITPSDKSRIIIALRHRDRVRRIRLLMPLPNLQELITALDNEFPILEYLYITPLNNTGLILPEGFRAPHLRRLILKGFAFSTVSPLLMTTVGLVNLTLGSSTDFHPHHLLTRLSLMPQLERLRIFFYPPHWTLGDDIENQPLDMPVMPHASLPNLRSFAFEGFNNFLEAFLAWINAPFLEKLEIVIFDLVNLSVAHLLQFINTTENLRFNSARLTFSNRAVFIRTYLQGAGASSRGNSFSIEVRHSHLSQKASAAARILNTLSPVFSVVEYLTLTLKCITYSTWPVPHESDELGATAWRELLKPFNNVKTLFVPYYLVQRVSDSLRIYAKEPSIGLLPELLEISHSATSLADDVFAEFIEARRIAGRPVTLSVAEHHSSDVFWEEL